MDFKTVMFTFEPANHPRFFGLLGLALTRAIGGFATQGQLILDEC
ncbi:MAG: hypothetical protein R3B47_16540 [Bacteroidia bacterium]